MQTGTPPPFFDDAPETAPEELPLPSQPGDYADEAEPDTRHVGFAGLSFEATWGRFDGEAGTGGRMPFQVPSDLTAVECSELTRACALDPGFSMSAIARYYAMGAAVLQVSVDVSGAEAGAHTLTRRLEHLRPSTGNDDVEFRCLCTDIGLHTFDTVGAKVMRWLAVRELAAIVRSFARVDGAAP